MPFASTTDMKKEIFQKILKDMEMFGNKSIRDIYKVSAEIFFGVGESLRQAYLLEITFRPRFRVIIIDWRKFMLNILPGFWHRPLW